MDSYIRDYNNFEIDTYLVKNINDYEKMLLSKDKSRNSFFSILHNNIRSITKNYNEFTAFLSQFSNQFDCIVLSETWNILDTSMFQISGYDILYNGGNYNKSDGVVVYVRDSLNYTYCVKNVANTSVMQINIEKGNKIIKVIALYKSPSINISAFNTDLKIFLDNLGPSDYAILIGDTNIDILSTDNIDVEEYLDILNENGFISQINKYTREQKYSKSCIDHIFLKSTTPDSKINSISSIIQSNVTDHYTITLDIPGKTVEDKTRGVNQNEILDNTKLIKIIENETWAELYSVNDPEICYNIFLNKIQTSIQKATSIKQYTSKSRKRKPWITTGIINSINRRDELHQEILKNPNNHQIKKEYVAYRNKINNLIKKSKNIYLKNIIYNTTNKIDSKTIWEGVKNITNSRPKINKDIKYIIKDNKKIDDDLEIAKSFNYYYANVGKNLAKEIDECAPLPCPQVHATLFLYPTDEPEIKKIIRELKNNKAPGKDKIRAEVIKDLEDIVAKPLCYIFNLILETGIYPSALKEAIIKPVHKSGDKFLMENYRPISLVSNFNKILEKIIKIRITKYCKKHELISDIQYGFQEGKSTNDAIAKLTSLIYSKIDQSKPSLAVFLDLAKAFDTVSHPQLLQKLESIGCRGVVLKLMQSYLQDRKQYVQIKNSVSDYETVEYGVPQGTVLGPIFFILYINDILTQNVKGQMVSFADDTAIFYSADTWDYLKIKVENDLERIKTYFDSKLLTINYKKTHYLPFTSLSSNLPAYDTINIQGRSKNIIISSAEKAKYLGIYIDRHLKWHFQIRSVVQKLRGLIYKFRIISDIMEIKHIRVIYKALVESILRYGIIGWGGVGETHLKPLNNIQKKIIKIIYKKKQ